MIFTKSYDFTKLAILTQNASNWAHLRQNRDNYAPWYLRAKWAIFKVFSIDSPYFRGHFEAIIALDLIFKKALILAPLKILID